MPYVTQQAKMVRNSAQHNEDEPGRHHHQRDRSDIDTKQVNLEKLIAPLPKQNNRRAERPPPLSQECFPATAIWPTLPA